MTVQQIAQIPLFPEKQYAIWLTNKDRRVKMNVNSLTS